jgi:hypothetical protein
VDRLVAAGAVAPPDMLDADETEKIRADARMMSALGMGGVVRSDS